MAHKIVCWRPMYDPSGHDLLRATGADVEIIDTPDAQAVAAALKGAHALWVRTPERVDAELMDAGENLVVISTSGFGTDNIDVPAATERGILVVNHQGFGRTPVAEHSIMLMLAALKQLIWTDRATRDASAWTERSGMRIYELEGKTVGLVGLGYIGAELAKKLQHGFNCRVLTYDPYVDPRLAHAAGAEIFGDLHAMLSECCLLCLAAELTDETRMIIGADELAALPKGAVVINAARGALLNLDALADALDSGHVAAAGLDVVSPEPLPDGHRLLTHPNTVMTPHTAGVTTEATNRLAHSACDQITAALAGRLPTFPVNGEVWDAANSRRPS